MSHKFNASVLQNLFNDNSEEAKLLAFQLELLKNYLGSFSREFIDLQKQQS